MKKTLQLLFTFLTLSMASAQDFTVANISYTVLSATEVEVQGTTLETLVVPSVVLNPETSAIHQVVRIGDNAFNGNTTLTSVELPDTVTSIGNSPFRSSGVASITFTTTSSITTIDSRGFILCTECTNLDEALSKVVTIGNGGLNTSGITSLTTGSALTSMGTSVIRATAALGTADLSASTLLTEIPGSTFRDSGIDTVILPSSITSIADNAFLNNANLATLELKSSTPIAINAAAFSGTTDISSATLLVPLGTTSSYANAAVWQDFGTITDGVTTLSINNVDVESNWNFYPNPTKGMVSVKSKQLNNATITVYDLNGRALLNKNINSTESEINISDLASGIYLFKVRSDNAEFVKRILKQ